MKVQIKEGIEARLRAKFGALKQDAKVLFRTCPHPHGFAPDYIPIPKHACRRRRHTGYEESIALDSQLQVKQMHKCEGKHKSTKAKAKLELCAIALCGYDPNAMPDPPPSQASHLLASKYKAKYEDATKDLTRTCPRLSTQTPFSRRSTDIQSTFSQYSSSNCDPDRRP